MKSNIKKSFTGIIAALLLSFNITAKADENPGKITIADAGKTIKEHIKFPNLLMNFNQEEKVDVVFTVNEEGQVNLVIANTQNLLLKKSIEQQFLKLKLTQLKPNNAYSIMFNFKTI